MFTQMFGFLSSAKADNATHANISTDSSPKNDLIDIAKRLNFPSALLENRNNVDALALHFSISNPELDRDLLKAKLSSMNPAARFTFLIHLSILFETRLNCDKNWLAECYEKISQEKRTDNFLMRALNLTELKPNNDIGRVILELDNIDEMELTDSLINKLKNLDDLGPILRALAQNNENLEIFFDHVQQLTVRHINTSLESIILIINQVPKGERSRFFNHAKILLNSIDETESNIDEFIYTLVQVSPDIRKAAITDTLNEIECRTLKTKELMNIFLKNTEKAQHASENISENNQHRYP